MATQNIAGSVQVNASFNEVITAGLISQLNLPASLGILGTFTNATNGANTCDQIHAKVYALAAAPTTIDLTSLTDLNANAMNFARVRLFLVYNADTTASHSVKVEAGASNGWPFFGAAAAPNFVEPLGGVLMLYDPAKTGAGNGMVVGASTKTITFDPGANTVNISVLIVGNSVL